MVVCQFFLRGNCRFGDSCRNEHPAGGQQSGFGSSSWTRPSGAATSSTSNTSFTPAIIASDLSISSDKPNWPLSSYAPAKYEASLLAGLDESPEELRTKYVAAMKAGNLNEYLQYESNKITIAEQLFANARENSTQAYEQALKQIADKGTSTTSAFGQPSGSVFPSTSSAFGSNAPATSAFGNVSTPSVFGTTPAPATSAFGNLTTTPAKSAFASTTTPSAFGSSTQTPSAFGSTTTPATSAFGNLTTTPSAFGSTPTSSAFGKPAFGQPAFGQPAFGQTGFGATPAPATTGAFGQPATTTPAAPAFGQPAPAATTSAFGQPAFGQPSFGQTSQPASSIIKPASGAFSAFAGTGASSFGSTATTTPAAAPSTGGGFSAFAGTPTAFGSTAATPPAASGSVFGQPSFGQPALGVATGSGAAPLTESSVFGTPTQPSGGSVFGAPSVFGALTQQQQGAPTSVFGGGSPSVFGSTTTAQTPGGAFSQMQTQAQPTSVFGGGGFGSLAPAQPALSAITPSAPSISAEMKSAVSQSKPLDFTSLKDVYKPDSTPYDAMLPSDYVDMLPKDVLEMFRAMKFEFGSVPEWVPPVQVR